MAAIESGNGSGAKADVDTTLKALQITPKGTGTVTYTSDDFTLDSFERARVSEPVNIFEYSFGAQAPATATNIWESTAFGAGTESLTTNLYATDLNTTTATGTGRWIQSFAHCRYAPGISTLLRFTASFNAAVTNVRSRVGMFTDQGTFPSTAGDGVFFELDGATLSVVRRYMTQGAGGTEERVNQSSWNLDKMDGTGASGVTLNLTKPQHMVIEYQWLGVGTIRFGFETGAKGIVWCHEMISVNAISEAWGRTGTLPVRAECYTFGTAAQAGKLTLINCVVQQEGIVTNRPWRYFGAVSGTTAKVGGTAAGMFPVISLRAASTNDLTKRATIIPVSFEVNVVVVGTGTTSLQVALIMNPTPNTGATFAGTVTGSVCTFDTAATATTAVDGTRIFMAVIPNVVGRYFFDLNTMALENANKIGYNSAGSVAITGSSVLTLGVGTLTGTTSAAATVVGTINWKELS